MRKTSKSHLKPVKHRKKRSEVEPGLAGDHTSTLKSELGFLRLQSMQALSNGGLEVEETLALVMCLLDDLIKIKHEFL